MGKYYMVYDPDQQHIFHEMRFRGLHGKQVLINESPILNDYANEFTDKVSLCYDLPNRPEKPYGYKSKEKMPTGAYMQRAFKRFEKRKKYDGINIYGD
jgi:hypothetical protein